MKFTRSGRSVYLDHASITPIDSRVLKVVNGVSTKIFANPSAVHSLGVEAKKIMEVSRQSVAQSIGAHADEIFFTGTGTEANNIVISGVIRAAQLKKTADKKIHVLVSAIEHASVLETVGHIAHTMGAADVADIVVEYVPVTAEGIIDLESFKNMLRPETVLVSIMLANNEIGTIQPIRDIVKIVRDFRKKISEKLPENEKIDIFVHTDACQAALYTEISVEKLGVDFLTLDSNKVYGPRGLGMLYKKRSIEIGKDILPMMSGGGQESELRSGTENVPAIAGFAEALRTAEHERFRESERLLALRTHFVHRLRELAPAVILNGSFADGERLPNNINCTFPNASIDHEYFMLELDVRGVACSTKSACLRDSDTSYVIAALDKARASHGSLRFSLGRMTTKKDIEYTLRMIDEVLKLHV